MVGRRRIAQLGIVAAVGGLAAGSSVLIFGSGAGTDPPLISTSSQGTPQPVPPIPDQVPIAGPKGYVGTVPRSDIVDAPPLTAAGTPPPVSDYPGASIVLGGHAGYAVMNNGVLAGYWVPGHLPSTFVTVAEAEAENAVPSQGASPVGTATAVTFPSAASPAP